MHEIAEELVASGREVRQAVLECAGRDLSRVQMPQSIELRRHDEQMHQVAVIGDEVVQAAAAEPARIPQRQPESSILTVGVASSGL